MNAAVALPEDVVEHIRSFMSFKTAAQLAVVSTRWYDAWYVSNSLLLDESEFRNANSFWFGAKQTIRRYISKRIPLYKLSLRLVCGYESYYDCKSLLEDACNLGVTEITIHLSNDNFNFLIPATVMSSLSLRTFSLYGGALDLGNELIFPVTSIQQLCLLPNRAIALSGDFFRNIVLRCPNLKHLTCRGLLLRVDPGGLVNLSHTLESLTVHNLLYQDTAKLNEIIRFFKHVKRVYLHQMTNGYRLYISSISIEEITVEDQFRATTAVLCLPNLKKLYFIGASCSSLKFESPAGGWTSFVSVVCYRTYNGDWYSSLHKMLSWLANSRIHLKVKVVADTKWLLSDVKVNGDPISVEKLDIWAAAQNPDIVDALFYVCIPKCFAVHHDYLHRIM